MRPRRYVGKRECVCACGVGVAPIYCFVCTCMIESRQTALCRQAARAAAEAAERAEEEAAVMAAAAAAGVPMPTHFRATERRTLEDDVIRGAIFGGAAGVDSRAGTAGGASASASATGGGPRQLVRKQSRGLLARARELSTMGEESFHSSGPSLPAAAAGSHTGACVRACLHGIGDRADCCLVESCDVGAWM